MIPDLKGDRRMGKVRKCVRSDDTITGEGSYNEMHEKSLYEVEYPYGTVALSTTRTTRALEIIDSLL